MNWIPGWDTAASAGWWSNLWFIVSIGSLALLGISEVISHRYSERKVALVEIAERAATKKHEDDMAELKLEAANSNERAATADERAAQASERAADANERAAKTELELAKFKAPRVLTPEQIAQLKKELKPVAKIPFDGAIAQLEESTNLFLQISLALQASGWDWQNWRATSIAMRLPKFDRTVGMASIEGVQVQIVESDREKFNASLVALINALNAFGIKATPRVYTDDAGRQLGYMPGLAHILVGTK